MPKRTAANDEEPGVACKPLPDYFPAALQGLPLRALVALTLTEHNGVNRGFYEKFAVDSVEQAMLRLLQFRGEYLVYRFVMSGANPVFSRDANWPLFRGGHARVATPRQLQSRVAPWDLVSDRTMFEIRNDPVTISTSRMFLRVGGRDDADALLRWEDLAKALRRLRVSVLAQIAGGTATLAGV